MGIKDDMRAWDRDAALQAKKLLHDMGYYKIMVDPALFDVDKDPIYVDRYVVEQYQRNQQQIKVLAEQEKARYQNMRDEYRNRLIKPLDEYTRAYWNIPKEEPKKEENMSEANYLAPKAIKAAPHLETYARNSNPVAAVQFTGNNVGELFDLLELKQALVCPADKEKRIGMRAHLSTNTGHSVVVDVDQYVVVEDGHIRVLDADIFEARYEEIRALKAEPSLSTKKAKRRK